MTALNGGAARVWHRSAVYVLVILLPVLLIGVSLWERSRAAEAYERYATAAHNMAASQEDIRELAAREPMAMINAGDRTITAAMAEAELEELVPMAQRGAWLSQVGAHWGKPLTFAQEPRFVTLYWGRPGGSPTLPDLVSVTVSPDLGASIQMTSFWAYGQRRNPS